MRIMCKTTHVWEKIAAAPATSDVIFCSETEESTENLCADFWQLAASFDASVSAQNIVPSTANARRVPSK